MPVVEDGEERLTARGRVTIYRQSGDLSSRGVQSRVEGALLGYSTGGGTMT